MKLAGEERRLMRLKMRSFERASAIKIQAFLRGFVVRKHLSSFHAEDDASEQQANPVGEEATTSSRVALDRLKRLGSITSLSKRIDERFFAGELSSALPVDAEAEQV
eukprot:CAMPEP_0172611264 /NCGR_PEP_ID=MMETSP1068-20121228/30978_1 /TAXON_ID=35684 /ORGANISM="Pseudopedinella elastica, Strain CCMP716" /LENGTH=106 /DNA_ID=CAMNT_0013415191 /DNA_START=71 /DNA_END=392 /DNA_ORIENTATION=+